MLVRSVRIDNITLDRLLNRLDESASASDANRRRETARYPYRLRGCIVHLQQRDDREPRAHLVATREISGGGFSFLHGSFVHTGSRCLVQLITAQGGHRDARGVVMHCRYVGGGLHSVGVRFDDPVQIVDLVGDAKTISPQAG